MKTPYESLIEAAQSLEMVTILEDWAEVDIELVPEFFEVNDPHLDLAREALDLKPSVNVEYNWDWYCQNAETLNALRNLANAFCLEMRLAKHRGDIALAADIGIDGMELANAVRRGGLIMGSQISVGFCAQIIALLRRFRANLAQWMRVQLVEQLTRIEKEREPFQIILERDKEWTRIVGPERAQTGPDTPLRLDPEETGVSVEDQEVLFEMLKPIQELSPEELNSLKEDQDHCTLASLRMLKLDLCLRSYQEEHDGYPESLEMLVPDLLKEIPTDPFSGKPFVYRKKSDISFDLYSFGPSRIDHGGLFGSWQKVLAGQVDYCLDCNDYEDGHSSF